MCTIKCLPRFPDELDQYDRSVQKHYEEGCEAGQSSLSFDQCSISSVSPYTDFVLHNVPTDQVIVINAGSTPQEIKITRGAYNIETIIAMLNASDAFSVRIGL